MKARERPGGKYLSLPDGWSLRVDSIATAAKAFDHEGDRHAREFPGTRFQAKVSAPVSDSELAPKCSLKACPWEPNT